MIIYSSNTVDDVMMTYSHDIHTEEFDDFKPRHEAHEITGMIPRLLNIQQIQQVSNKPRILLLQFFFL